MSETIVAGSNRSNEKLQEPQNVFEM